MMITVAADGTGDFTSISAALQTLSEETASPVTLLIRPGIYRERPVFKIPRMTILGEDAASTVITGDLSANLPSEDIGRLGTFRTYTALIDASHITVKHITFENTAGCGSDAGQALALYAEGDCLTFESCRFLGGQDTLFTGPLPEKELIPGGFTGPKQSSPRINGRQHYKNCYIEGDIDFVFGSASVYFEDCEFFSKAAGYVTAASTPDEQLYGYVMERCRFTGSCPPGSVYLGRPWRNYAKTVLIDCFLGDHIHPEGFHDWNKPDARQTSFFAEYGSFGPGFERAKRPGWVKQFTDAEAQTYLSLFKKFMTFMLE